MRVLDLTQTPSLNVDRVLGMIDGYRQGNFCPPDYCVATPDQAEALIKAVRPHHQIVDRAGDPPAFLIGGIPVTTLRLSPMEAQYMCS